MTRGTGRPNLSRETKSSGANGGREYSFFLSSKPRTGLATADVTGYTIVEARSVNVKNSTLTLLHVMTIHRYIHILYYY